MGDLYLGLDLSTQSLKSVLIDDQLNLVHSDVVVLDELGWDFLFRSILVSDSTLIRSPVLVDLSVYKRDWLSFFDYWQIQGLKV